jgi:Protein of unknown function (DUF2380)
VQIYNLIITLFTLILSLNSAIAAETTASKTNKPKRLVLMDFKLMGATGEAKLDAEHQARLKMANAELHKNLAETKQYDLVSEADSAQFNQQVGTALKNKACDSCELALAKPLNIQKILYPLVYKLSNLVLTLHVVIIDAATGKAVVKKVHDFRGDNDQSWQRAIQYFVKNVNS